MEPQQIEQVTGWKAIAAEVLALAAILANPMGLAIIMNVVVVNALEMWDHLLPKKLLKPDTTEISLGMAATLAFLIQPVVFALVCIGANWPVRGEMFVHGLVGGAIGSAVGGVLAHYGWSLDGAAERLKRKREEAAKP